MTTAPGLLQRVWERLKDAGIYDNLAIVEYIAALLTEDMQPLSEDLKPRKALPHQKEPFYSALDEHELKPLLNEASSLAGGKSRLFDRFVLFQSAGQQPYVISPRHIVDFMLALIHVEPKHRFADFACGSGGFLIRRAGDSNNEQGRTVGVDIWQSMARIAGANAVLHGMTGKHTHIYIGNAFRICGPSGELGAAEFDRIAMAPPFGIREEDLLRESDASIEETLGVKSARTFSENLFTRLALAKLASGGQAIIVVPSGMLVREGADLALRETILREYGLRAVISLNKGVLQPFISAPLSLLLLHRDRQPGVVPWFFTVEYDGYAENRGRDLRQPSLSGKSDLLLVQAVLDAAEYDLWLVPREAISADKVLSVNPLLVGGQFVGIIVKAREPATIASLKRFAIKQGNGQVSYILAEVMDPDRNVTLLAMPLASEDFDLRTIQRVSSIKAWLAELSQPRTRIPVGTHLFGPGQPGQAVVLSNDGRVLGLTQSYAAIQGANGNLLPEYYIQPGEEVNQPPVMMLNDIRRDQQTVARYVDQLLGHLEIKPIAEQPLPPRLYDVADFKILNFLGAEQRSVWEKVLQQTDPEHKYGLYFTRNQVLHENETKTQQALDLLERLGLIVQVTVSHPGTGRTASYYRRITELDVTDISSKRTQS